MKLKEWQKIKPELQNIIWEYLKYKNGYDSKITNILYGYMKEGNRNVRIKL